MVTNDTVSGDAQSQPSAGLLPNLTVWTPEIDKLCVTVARWVRMDLPGGTVYGQQRNGKTRAAKYLILGIGSILGYSTAVLHWVIPDQRDGKQTEREFIQEQLQQSGCNRVASRDLAVLRRRCHTHLVELAKTAGSKRIIIMVDEAQNLTRAQYGYLIYCYNALEQLGVYPFFLLIGQPELRNAPQSWHEASAMQVLGRFFAREFIYRGVDCDSIGEVLDAFDSPVEDEALPPLQQTFPAAYAAGFRLQNLTDAYVEAMQLVMKQHNVASGLRLPMQYLRASLLGLLHRCIDEHLALEHVNSAMVFQALKDAEFFSVLAYYVDAPDMDSDAGAAARGGRA
ncbi:ATP-binding protein [Caenimonas sedimenti]|nr:ATP-binding protein [Caenimonas sedimenti]